MSDRDDQPTTVRAPLDREAFERCVLAHHAAVYRTSLRIVRRPDDALDVTQRVFLAVLEGRLDLARAEDPARALRWWAVRTALAHLRGERHVQAREERYAMRRDEAREDRTIEGEEARSVLERTIGALPDELRLPLELRYREELTFAAIGSTLAIAESAAHDRVRRAIDRLRAELSRLGFGAYAIGIEGELAREASRPAAPVPPDLATKLLALEAPTFVAAGAATATGAWLGVACAAAFVVAGLAWAVTRAPSDASSSGVLASVGASVRSTTNEPRMHDVGDAQDPPRVREAPEAPPRGLGYVADVEPGGVVVVRGRVVDEQGFAVAGARVVAGVAGKGGPEMREHGSAVTGLDGRYRIEVKLSTRAETFEVDVRGEGAVQRDRPVLRAHAGRELVVPPIAVTSSAIDPDGDWALALRVVDADGRPVDRMPVRVFRRGTSVFGTPGNEWEAGGLTDARGAIDLAGTKLGRKLVVLDGRDLGWRLAREKVEVAAPGRVELTLRVERGLVVAGTVRDVDGAPASGAIATLRRSDDLAYELDAGWRAIVDEHGRFRITGVDPLACTLRVEGGAWSAAELPIDLAGASGLARASREDLDVVLKRHDDEREVGTHMGELHGTLRDAVTGAAVVTTWGAVEAVLVSSETRVEFLRGEAHALLDVPMRQTMISPDWIEPPATSTFHATGLPAGTYVLVARTKDHATSFAGPFPLAPNALVANVVIELQRPTALRGVVRDAKGAPIANALIATFGGGNDVPDLDELDAEVVATEGHPRDLFRFRRTDASGRFAIQASPGVALRVAALDPRHAPETSAPIVVSREDVRANQVELVMARGR